MTIAILPAYPNIEDLTMDLELKPSICLVCGRASNTGQHYGVTACLGCKTFFRRVVLQGGSPQCKNNGDCILRKGAKTKRLCRSCRFEKCKDIGMKEQALHPCRDLIGRRNELQSDSVSSRVSPTSSVSSDQLGRLSLAAEDALSFLTGIRDVDTAMRMQSAEFFGVTPDDETLFYAPKASTSYAVNEDLARSLQTDLMRLPEWVRTIPTFNQLTTSTKHFLVHRFCLMYSVIENGLFTHKMPEQNDMWFLLDGTCLFRDAPSMPEGVRAQVSDKVVEQQKLLAPLTSLLIDEIANPLRRLQPSREEVAALKILMLMRPTILMNAESRCIATDDDRRILCEMRSRILFGLHSYYLRKGEEHLHRRMDEVLMLCGGIEVCAAQGLEIMHMFRFFDMGTFDEHSSRLIFGNNST